jgi:phage shock protein C
MNRTFALDRANAKLMGVCSGLADTAGADVTLVRIAAVASLLLLGPVTLILYLATGWIAPARG